MQYSVECFCGHFEPIKDLRIDEGQCDKACSGDTNRSCGGYLTMNIYKSLQSNPVEDNQLQINDEEVGVAYLFVVHGRSYRQILRHLKWLYNPSDYFFFHVDSRSSYLYRSLKELEKKSPNNIKVTDNRWATIWGGASLLKMMMSCMSEMKSMQWNMDFVINISESDYLLKEPKELKKYLTENRGKNFVKSHGRETATFVKKQGKYSIITSMLQSFPFLNFKAMSTGFYYSRTTTSSKFKQNSLS